MNRPFHRKNNLPLKFKLLANKKSKCKIVIIVNCLLSVIIIKQIIPPRIPDLMLYFISLNLPQYLLFLLISSTGGNTYLFCQGKAISSYTTDEESFKVAKKVKHSPQMIQCLRFVLKHLLLRRLSNLKLLPVHPEKKKKG